MKLWSDPKLRELFSEFQAEIPNHREEFVDWLQNRLIQVLITSNDSWSLALQETEMNPFSGIAKLSPTELAAERPLTERFEEYQKEVHSLIVVDEAGQDRLQFMRGCSRAIDLLVAGDSRENELVRAHYRAMLLAIGAWHRNPYAILNEKILNRFVRARNKVLWRLKKETAFAYVGEARALLDSEEYWKFLIKQLGPNYEKLQELEALTDELEVHFETMILWERHTAGSI